MTKWFFAAYMLTFFPVEAMAALTWVPNQTDSANGAQYTIKRVWDFWDGSNVITQVEVNETVSNFGCTQARANTFYIYSQPMTGFHQTVTNKLLAAQLAGHKIRMAMNQGGTGWCSAYGVGLWGVDVIIPQE